MRDTNDHRLPGDAVSASLIERLVPDVLSAQPTAESIGALKLCLLHFLTCAFEARDLPWSRQARAVAMRSPGPASIVGHWHRSSEHDAAFANAVAGHGLVREDMHAGAVSHLGVVVLPAMLALVQRRCISGREFAAACIIGYEVGCRVGRVLVTPDFIRSWRPTGFTGPLAAAAAGARLLQLPAPAAASALALAANCACGLNQWPREGGEEMFFHPGTAARNALMAVDLAELGAYGAAGALDGEAGLLAATGSDPAAAAGVRLFPAGEAEILAVFRKDLPVCNFAQTPCQAALQVARGNRLPSSAINRVIIKATDAAIRYPGCDSRGPFERVLQAKMSIPFCVAVALVDGEISEASFAAMDRPELQRVVAKTTLMADPMFTEAFPARQGAEVIVELADGSRRTARMADLEAASAGQVSSRFLDAARQVIGHVRTEQLARSVADLEIIDDMRALVYLTEADKPPAV